MGSSRPEEASHAFCFEGCVLERIIRFLTVLLIGCCLLPGCAYFSKNGRQQMAYQRYVKKCIRNRDRQRRKITKEKRAVPPHEESDWHVNSGVATGGETSGD